MLGIMAGLDQKDRCLEEYRKFWFPYSTLSLDFSGTRYASVTEEIWMNFQQFRMRSGLRILRSIHALLSEL